MNKPTNFKANISYNGTNYSFSEKFENDDFAARLYASDDGVQLEIEPHREVSFDKIYIEADILLKLEEKLFLNGYQSWTDSRELSLNARMRGLIGIPRSVIHKYSFDRYGDYNFTNYSTHAGELHGYTYGYLRDKWTYTLFGSLSERNGYTVIYTSFDDQKIVFEKDCDGVTFSEPETLMDIAVLEGEETEVFDKYFELMGVPAPTAKPISGYTSWYNHYQDIDEFNLMHDLASMCRNDPETEIFQIDDGYQRAVGDWLDIDGMKFPEGIKKIADTIHDHGLKAGLWLAPFVCEENSEIYREHKGWLLRGTDGDPMKAGCNWSGSYALDLYNPEVREYLRHVFDVILNDWGFDLVKLDFLYAVCMIPQNGKSRGQVMCEAMDFLRECVGDKLILACGIPLAPAFGVADYCRIGCDVGLDWNDNAVMRMTHRERVSTKHSMYNTVYRRQLNGRAFLNDPDVFLLRDENMQMYNCQRQSLAAINHIFGSVFFTSDDMDEYGVRQHKTLRTVRSLRDAKVSSVDTEGNTIVITLENNGKSKTFRLLSDGRLTN
ncbi:MAG: alpha-galactosidase [Ruminococcus sp.]|nr:alpha-galactosidase [Ruminococcus sp.]